MFPKDFVWGVAASAYQTEGTDPKDGRGRCIWDAYVDAGKAKGGADAYTACDFMHRYKDDIALMGQMGIRAFRFSVSWSLSPSTSRNALWGWAISPGYRLRPCVCA